MQEVENKSYKRLIDKASSLEEIYLAAWMAICLENCVNQHNFLLAPDIQSLYNSSLDLLWAIAEAEINLKDQKQLLMKAWHKAMKSAKSNSSPEIKLLARVNAICLQSLQDKKSLKNYLVALHDLALWQKTNSQTKTISSFQEKSLDYIFDLQEIEANPLRVVLRGALYHSI